MEGILAAKCGLNAICATSSDGIRGTSLVGLDTWRFLTLAKCQITLTLEEKHSLDHRP